MKNRVLLFVPFLAACAGCATDADVAGMYVPSCVAFEGSTIELVILDMIMPDMDGAQTFLELRAMSMVPKSTQVDDRARRASPGEHAERLVCASFVAFTVLAQILTAITTGLA